MQQLFAGTVHPRCRLGFLIATLAVAFCAASLHARTTPTLAVSLSPTSPQHTDTITVTATVTGSGSPQPTGTVTYSVDGGSTASASITQTGAKGIAYFPIAAQAPGLAYGSRQL